jgi:succinate-semialdehyde dehydrogenase/glutarate-semialdehyde dehydrogenase
MNDPQKDPLAAVGVIPALWIDGQWRQGGAGSAAVRNPATGAEVAHVCLAAEADFRLAIDGAHRTFAAWRSEPCAFRGEVLKRAATLLAARRSELAGLLTREQGKPLAQALGEVDYAASFFQWFGEEARRLGGRLQPHPLRGREYTVRHVAAGVAGLVTPWNFPLAQGAKKIAACLAAGCTAVWKPSELTPLVALAMGPLLKEAGLPDGALQILPSLGPVAGAALTADARIRVLSLTGSTNTGRTLMQGASRHLQRVSFELGGNAPFVILGDAELGAVAEDLVKLKMLCCGQVCVTANRVFVPESLEGALIAKLLALWSGLRVGDGLGADIDAGPLIHHKACERVRGLVDGALADGAECVAENRSHEGNPSLARGSFFPPTILRKVSDRMALAREEIFGPVLALMTYRDTAEAVRRANSTEFGLAAYVYGNDLSLANAVADELEAGIVGINEWRPLRAEVPFGGMKSSGMGREGGEEGLMEFCDVKVVSSPCPPTRRP